MYTKILSSGARKKKIWVKITRKQQKLNGNIKTRMDEVEKHFANWIIKTKISRALLRLLIKSELLSLIDSLYALTLSDSAFFNYSALSLNRKSCKLPRNMQEIELKAS